MPGTPGILVAGRYRLDQSIGQGGMGRVWRAVDEMLDRPVAVKEMHITETDAEDNRIRRERVLREARATARIDHPHVVRVYDVVEEGDRLWIVMELVESRSLEALLVEDGPVPPGEAARIGLGLVAALREVHAVGVLHRDIKPGNVLLGRAGRVVLTDFGIAAIQDAKALTVVGMLVGSPDYMAPERIGGRAQGPASDLWSLGATLCAAAAGHSPFARPTTLSTLHAVLYEEPELPSAVGPLRPVLSALLVKTPEERPDLDELERMLREIVSPRYVPTVLVEPPPPLAPEPEREQEQEPEPESEQQREPGPLPAQEPAPVPPVSPARPQSDPGPGAATVDSPALAKAGLLPVPVPAPVPVPVDPRPEAGPEPGHVPVPVPVPVPVASRPRPEAEQVALPQGAAPAPSRPETVRERAPGAGTLSLVSRPGPSAGRRPGYMPPVPGRGGAAEQPTPHRTRTLLLAALAAATLATLTVVVLNSRSDTPTTGATHTPPAQAGPTVAGTSRPPTAATGTPTNGIRSETGFAWAPPGNWTRSAKSPSNVHYHAPDGQTEIAASYALARGGDLLTQWQKFERDSHDAPGYRKIRLERTTFRGHPGIVWEYVFAQDGTPWRARQVGFTAGGKSYQLNLWYAAAGQEAALATYEEVTESFTPL